MKPKYQPLTLQQARQLRRAIALANQYVKLQAAKEPDLAGEYAMEADHYVALYELISNNMDIAVRPISLKRD